MTARPAVAMAGALDEIHERLAEFVARLPASSRALLAAALLPAAAHGGDSGPARAACRNDFYWLLIPEWLARGQVAMVDEILWAQYCVYCQFRTQDDVVDGDADDPHLAVAANVLACEAGRALARALPGRHRFWAHYHDAIATTSCSG